MDEDDEVELERLREIAALVRELFELEQAQGGMLPRTIPADDVRDTAEIERRLQELVGLSAVSTDPELQHQYGCPHPMKPCSCRRSHLLAEARRLAAMIPRSTGRLPAG